MNDVRISILIPVFNAAEYLDKTAEYLIKYCDKQGFSYEVLFCDDASRDNSRQIICDFSQKYEQVKIRFNEENKGLGNTLRRMMVEARGEYIVYCDGDLPFGTDIIKPLIDELENYDIVVASRYEGIKGERSVFRMMISRLYYYLCKLFFNITVKDIGSGTVAMRKSSIKPLRLKSEGFNIHMEMYVKAKRAGLKILEVPVASRNIKTSSFNALKFGPGLLFGLIAFWIESLKGESSR